MKYRSGAKAAVSNAASRTHTPNDECLLSADSNGKCAFEQPVYSDCDRQPAPIPPAGIALTGRDASPFRAGSASGSSHQTGSARHPTQQCTCGGHNLTGRTRPPRIGRGLCRRSHHRRHVRPWRSEQDDRDEAGRAWWERDRYRPTIKEAVALRRGLEQRGAAASRSRRTSLCPTACSPAP